MIPSSYNPNFKSAFSKKLKEFLLYKRSIGYKYERESRELARFDRYFIINDITELTYDNLQNLAFKRESESPKTHSLRLSILREFMLYLNKRYKLNIPILIKSNSNNLSNSFVPYIFTKKQICQILKEVDKMQKKCINSNIQFIMPVLIRILYCCGLRITEATTLKICNINLKYNTITVLDSKNNDSRILPISDTLKNTISNYLDKIYINPNENDFVFPTIKMEQYSINTIYSRFREILWRCEIPHGGRGKGPRLHDLRHTFAVHSIQKLIKDNKDIYLILPILSTYLGHKNIHATEKYIRLTAEMYPDILEKIKSNIGKLVPEVTDYEI